MSIEKGLKGRGRDLPKEKTMPKRKAKQPTAVTLQPFEFQPFEWVDDWTMPALDFEPIDWEQFSLELPSFDAIPNMVELP